MIYKPLRFWELIYSLFRFINMKTTLIFFGIVTFAFAAYPTDLKECQHPEAMKNFDLDKFMKGTWYVTNAKHGSDSTVCREYKSIVEKGNQVLVGDGYYSFSQNLKMYFKVRCKKLPEENGKLIFDCTQNGPIAGNDKMNFEFRLEVTVLSTDYENSAVMYRCVKFPEKLGSRIEDNLLVLRRDVSKIDNEDTIITNALKSQGLSLESLKSRKGVTCQKLPQKRNI